MKKSNMRNLHECGCGCPSCGGANNSDDIYQEFVIEPYEYSPIPKNSDEMKKKSMIAKPSLLGPQGNLPHHSIALGSAYDDHEEYYSYDEYDSLDNIQPVVPLELAYLKSLPSDAIKNYILGIDNVDNHENEEDHGVTFTDDYVYIEDYNTYVDDEPSDDYDMGFSGHYSSPFEDFTSFSNESKEEESFEEDDLLLDANNDENYEYGNFTSSEGKDDVYMNEDNFNPEHYKIPYNGLASYGEDNEEDHVGMKDNGFQSIIINSIDDPIRAYTVLINMGVNGSTAQEVVDFASNGSEVFLGSYPSDEVSDKLAIFDEEGIGYKVENEKNAWTSDYTEDDQDDSDMASIAPQGMSMDDAVAAAVNALEKAGLELNKNYVHVGLIKVITPIPVVTAKRIVSEKVPSYFGMDTGSGPIYYISDSGVDIQF
jgi:hypothetical protein